MTKIQTTLLGGALLWTVSAPVALAAPKDGSKVTVYDTVLPAGLTADGDQVKVVDDKRYQNLGKIETTWVDEKHETNAAADVEARKVKIVTALQKEVAKRHGNTLIITSWFRRDDVDPVTNTVRESFDKIGAEGIAIQDATPTLKVADAAPKSDAK
jgi:hypothetical protein